MEHPLDHQFTEEQANQEVPQTDASTETPVYLAPTESASQPTDLDEPADIAGTSISTRIRYSLRFTGWPNLSQLVTIAVAAAVYTALSYVTITALPNPALGVSPLFIAIGFGIPFALWFGGWAFVIAYLGNFIGAGLLSHLPILVSIPFGAADFIQLCIPMLLYRLLAPRFGVSSIGKDVFTVRGFIFFLCVAVIPNNIIGGLYGNLILVVTGQEPGNLFIASWITWSVTNMIIVAILGSILLSQLGPVVERFGLTVRDLLR
jgi:integral membrane sensor domain MASE1